MYFSINLRNYVMDIYHQRPHEFYSFIYSINSRDFCPWLSRPGDSEVALTEKSCSNDNIKFNFYDLLVVAHMKR